MVDGYEQQQLHAARSPLSAFGSAEEVRELTRRSSDELRYVCWEEGKRSHQNTYSDSLVKLGEMIM